MEHDLDSEQNEVLIEGGSLDMLALTFSLTRPIA